MSLFVQVDLRFPQSGAADPNLVTVTGRPEMVDEAIDHLLNLEEEYVSTSHAAAVVSTHLISTASSITTPMLY